MNDGGDDIVLGTYVSQGFLNDHNIEASYTRTIGLVIMSTLKNTLIVFMIRTLRNSTTPYFFKHYK